LPPYPLFNQIFHFWDFLYSVVYLWVLKSDDGLTTETCSYLYISNITSYDINVA
jgi:hypothetical protein